MKFSELRDSLKTEIKELESMNDYHTSYFKSSIQSLRQQIADKNVYHLYGDILGHPVEKDLEAFLNNFYKTADNYASDCIDIAYHVKHIYGLKVKNWTDSALKCFDTMLLKIINDILKEKIIQRASLLKERDVYNHLQEKPTDTNYYVIGVCFNAIYEERNSFTHVQIEEKEGVRKYRPISNKKYKDSRNFILEQFKKGLDAVYEEVP